jgi:uncharacterized iron-regulated membrane protein
MRAPLRRLVFSIHFWFGWSLGIYLVLMGVTGSLLTFRHALDAALSPRLLTVDVGKARRPLDELVAAVSAEHPGRVPSRLDFYPEAHRSVGVLLAGKPSRQVFVNPYTAKVLGDRDPDAPPIGWIYRLHRNLLLGDPGHTANAYAALAGSWLVLTGLLLWWPRTRGQFGMRVRVQWRGTAKRRIHDLHNVFGFYSLPLLLVVLLTGATFEFKKPVAQLLGAPPEPPRIREVAPGPHLPFERLLARAEGAAPGRTSYVFLPSSRSPAFRIIRELPGGESLRRRATVAVDPATGGILRVEGLEAPWGKVLAEAMAPIHFGHWGGLPSRLIQVALGFVPLALLVTGIAKSVARIRGRKAVRSRG